MTSVAPERTRGQHPNWWLEEVPQTRDSRLLLPQQCQLVLVKMHKVQEMSNNFSNDINPFHVYDKRSPASLAKCRWWRDDDDACDAGGAGWWWCKICMGHAPTAPTPPHTTRLASKFSCSSCGGVGFASALVFSNVLSCTLWDVERQRNAKDGWVRKVVHDGAGWSRVVEQGQFGGSEDGAWHRNRARYRVKMRDKRQRQEPNDTKWTVPAVGSPSPRQNGHIRSLSSPLACYPYTGNYKSS